MRGWKHFLLVGILIPLAQNWGAVGYMQTRGKTSSLVLRTSVINEKYCLNGGENLKVRLRLHYTNVGKKRIILYKGSSLVSNIFVSRNADAAIKKQYVQIIRNEIVFPSDLESVDFPIPKEPFALIEPKGSFTTEAEVDIPVEEPSDPQSGLLRPGNYFAQFEIATWHHAPDLAAKLKRRWAKVGKLWNRPLLSVPMFFTIQRDRHAVKCE